MSLNLVKDLERRGFSKEQIAKARLIDGTPVVEFVEKMQKKAALVGFRSKTEALYAMNLDHAKEDGLIQDWRYEPFSLLLAKAEISPDEVETIIEGTADKRRNKRGSWYQPDFLVVLNDGRMEFHEIKGFMREAARVRFLVAKRLYPWFAWKMITYRMGSWEIIL